MTYTDNKIDLVINKMTQEQYEAAKTQGSINANELYITEQLPPSKTSDLVNDSGFITASAIPSQVSAFENDVGYVTASTLSFYEEKSAMASDVSSIVLKKEPYLPSRWHYPEMIDDSYYAPDSTWVIRNGDPSKTYYVIDIIEYDDSIGTWNVSGEKFEYYQQGDTWEQFDPITGHSTQPQDTLTLTIDGISWGSGELTLTRDGYNALGLAMVSDVPSKTSDLVNDAGYITASAIPSNVSAFNNDAGYVTASAIPTRVSQLQNDASYTNPSAVRTLIGEKERKWNVSGLPAGYEWRTSVSESYNDATQMWYYDISIYNVTLDEYATSTNSPYSSATQVTTFTINDFRIWPEGSESPLMTFDATATFVGESSAYGFAYEVKQVETVVDVQVPQTIQGWGEVPGALQLSSELREQDPQHRVWWVYYDYSQELDLHCKYWACYDPTADTDIAATAFIGWNTTPYVSGEGHAFPWEYSDGELASVTMWGNMPDDFPTRQGMPPIGYDHWHDYFASQAATRKIYATWNSDVGVWYDVSIYGYETLHVLPSTATYDVVYEDELETQLGNYAPLRKHMTYEGDVLVPSQIEGSWVSVSPAMGRLNLNSSYMQQDTRKRVWWSAELSYEPEPDTPLYKYVVAVYDAANDTFTAQIWLDKSSGLPANISDLGDPDQSGSFTRASGWATWRDFFYNPPEVYEVSYGNIEGIDLYGQAFVNSIWGGTFDVVYQGELVNAYATRQYVDEQIGNILTEEF